MRNAVAVQRSRSEPFPFIMANNGISLNMTCLLRADSVSYAYEPGQPVLASVNAAITNGDILGIIGPNGSGKSTLLRVLCGLLRPQQGRVSIDGRPLASFSSIERARQLAFLPHAVNPAFSLTTFEVVCLGRYPHIGAMGAFRPHDKEIVERCMLDTGTADLSDRDFTSLSGGERQRVLIASILAQQPSIVLLDEPTSTLDIHQQVAIVSLIQRLALEGRGFGVVMHDLNLAAQCCNRLLLLGAGHRVLAEGSNEQVLKEAAITSHDFSRCRCRSDGE